MKNIIYLDNASTTRVSRKVVNEMIPYLTENYGNPSSTHALGIEARKALENSKKDLAKVINCNPFEIIFTASGSETNSLIILGCAKAQAHKKRLIISSIEHSSIYESAMELKRQRYEIIEIKVNRNGEVDLEELRSKIDENTFLVSIAHVNSETGIIQDIEKIGKICQERGVLFHTDALQSYGKLHIDVKKMNISLLSAAAHKVGGPKGVGLGYIKEGTMIIPLVYGGGQEKGLRSGTENVAGAVGFASAIKENHYFGKTKQIRDYFVKEVKKIGGIWNGTKEKTIFCHANISFIGYNGANLVSFLSERGIMCSTGSACDNKKEEKRVLSSIGLSKEAIEGTVRFVFSSEISIKDVDYVIKQINTFMRIYKKV